MKPGLTGFQRAFSTLIYAVLLASSLLDPRFLVVQACDESLSCFRLLNNGRLEILAKITLLVVARIGGPGTQRCVLVRDTGITDPG